MSVLYIVVPIAIVFAVVALVVFIAVVRSGQLDDTETPAVRMLHDETDPTPAGPRDESEVPDRFDPKSRIDSH